MNYKTIPVSECRAPYTPSCIEPIRLLTSKPNKLTARYLASYVDDELVGHEIPLTAFVVTKCKLADVVQSFTDSELTELALLVESERKRRAG